MDVMISPIFIKIKNAIPIQKSIVKSGVRLELNDCEIYAEYLTKFVGFILAGLRPLQIYPG